VYKDYETEEEARAQERVVEPLMNESENRDFTFYGLMRQM
jgi:hypothetical protein